MSRLTQGGTAEPVFSRDQILRRERGQGKIRFPYSADHGQDWQPNPVDPYSSNIICGNRTYILHTCNSTDYLVLHRPLVGYWLKSHNNCARHPNGLLIVGNLHTL